MEKKLVELRPQQIRAIESIDHSVAVIASAGSGKTRVLTERIKYILNESHIFGHEVLAFTFTEKAALEMKERLEPDLNHQRPHISTIHSYCHRLLKKWSLDLGLNPSFEVMTPAEEEAALSQRLNFFFSFKKAEKCPLFSQSLQKHGSQRLSSIIKKLLADSYFKKLILENKNFDDHLLKLTEDFFKNFLQKKIQENTLSFDDLEFLSLKAFYEKPDILLKEKNKYQHLLVDEFQDTNDLQAQLIRSLWGKKTKLFIVGDPKQSIYRFRKANVRVFYQIKKEIETSGGQEINLSETFRCSPKVTQAVNQVFSQLFPPSLFDPMVSMKKSSNDQCIIRAHENLDLSADQMRHNEAHFIAKDIVTKINEGQEAKSIALLFRNSKAMLDYASIFSDYSIPYSLSQSHNLFDTQVIIDLVYLIKYLDHDREKLTKTILTQSKLFHLSLESQKTLMNLEDFLGPLETFHFLSRDEENSIQLFRVFFQNLKYWKENFKPSHTLRKAIRWLEENFTATNSYLEISKLDIETFLNMIEKIQEKYDSETLDVDLYQNLNQETQLIKDSKSGIKKINTKQNQNSVQFLTIHSSKGLEFETVYLPQLYSKERPHSHDYFWDESSQFHVKELDLNTIQGLKADFLESEDFLLLKEEDTKENLEEMKRLLYVAMTRSQRELYLFIKKNKKEKKEFKEAKNINDWIEFLMRDQIIWLEDSHNFKINKVKTQNLVEAEKEINLNKSFISEKYYPLFTATEIETFSRCEKEYELKYIHQIDPLNTKEDKITALQWGLIVHEVFQFIDFLHFENEETVIQQALKNQSLSLEQKNIKEKLHQTLNKIKNNRPLLEEMRAFIKKTNEFPFLMKIDHFLIKGSIDSVLERENSLLIIDYKTDKVYSQKEAEEKSQNYEVQMGLYALACHKIYSQKTIKTALLYTEGPYLLIKEWSFEELKSFERKMSQTINRIINKKQSLSKQDSLKSSPFNHLNSKTCQTCSFYPQNLCQLPK